MEKILITGATGNVGLATLKYLGEKNLPGVELLAAVRDEERAHHDIGAGNCQFIPFEFDEPSTYAAALEGVTKILLVRPHQLSDVSKYIYPFLDEAARRGVKQIVFLSVIGAERNKLLPHYKIENYLLNLGVSYTFVRPCFFMQNLTTIHRREILENNKVYIPAGNTPVNYIDVRDVAEVMGRVLTEPGHENMTYEITGSQTMTYYELVGILSSVLDREIRYPRPSTLMFMRQKIREKKPLSFVKVMSLLYSGARNGKMNLVTEDFQRLTGRDPIDFKTFANEYKQKWIKQEKK